MKTSELLRKAADEIRRRGWRQEDFGSYEVDHKNCPVCAWGAVNIVVNGDPWSADLDTETIIDWMATKLELGASVPAWNDEIGRTVEEVLDAFERAAVAAEEEEE